MQTFNGTRSKVERRFALFRYKNYVYLLKNAQMTSRHYGRMACAPRDAVLQLRTCRSVGGESGSGFCVRQNASVGQVIDYQMRQFKDVTMSDGAPY